MKQGRKRSEFFGKLQASLEDILKDCRDRKVTPQDSGRVLKVNHPQARQRAGCFRGSTLGRVLASALCGFQAFLAADTEARLGTGVQPGIADGLIAAHAETVVAGPDCG
jgi:hypothetical protein